MKLSISALLATTAVVLAAPTLPDTPHGLGARAMGVFRRASPKPTKGYSRAKFPHWTLVPGTTCDAREFVLKRDGTDVVITEACTATSGSWTSPYDGVTSNNTDGFVIDHVVPLKNAWVSGAFLWPTGQRQAFANDVVRPQLQAVTDSVSKSKHGWGPDKWKPPLKSAHCGYATAWVEVKTYYGLTATNAEKAALKDMLSTC